MKLNFIIKFFLNSLYYSIVSLSLFLGSCSKDISKYANLKLYDEGNSFAFIVSDELSKKVKNSTPKMTKKETKLLEILLERKGFCMKNSSKPTYAITTKQEKIYDITYAKMIEENYNAKSITPVTYFGKCVYK